jgi:hypothetical protein
MLLVTSFSGNGGGVAESRKQRAEGRGQRAEGRGAYASRVSVKDSLSSASKRLAMERFDMGLLPLASFGPLASCPCVFQKAKGGLSFP